MKTKTLGKIQLLVGILILLIEIIAIVTTLASESWNFDMIQVEFLLVGMGFVLTALPNLKK